MLLSTLLKGILVIPSEMDLAFSDLTLDSRHVKPNTLFIALKGTQSDGRQFIPQAIAQGAVAILVESDQASITHQGKVPVIGIVNLRYLTAQLAARFYQYPATQLKMIGVTGTNGKTSCTHFIAQSLQALSGPCGLIGTLGSGFYGELGEAGLTTPDAISLQARLKTFFDKGAKAVAMEVSSHSIDQGRVEGLPFDVGIFTNLTQDHLDYHGTMENYAAVKRRFLAEWPIKNIVLNADDEFGRQWINELKTTHNLFCYSLQSTNLNAPATYVKKVMHAANAIHAQIVSPWGEGQLRLPLIGQFNLSNSLASLASLCLLGIDFETALQQLAQLKPVPGRMQTLGGEGQPLVVVDYAHSPDALEKVLQALRHHVTGRLICVFGCGGDRDHGKRPLMAKVVEKWADKIIVTNDNPRHESPEAIAAEIMTGFKTPQHVTVTLDRSQAIQNSIQWAKTDDCILIAGKGAEHYQQINDQKIPFDDVDEVKRFLGHVEMEQST